MANEKLNKEYLYVGHYIDSEGNYILKVGTTNDLQRRRTDHSRYYRKTPNHPIAPGTKFEYDWWIALSKYNTLRYEDKTRTRWQEENIGNFIHNDRFVCENKPDKVEVTIRKTYTILL